MIVTIVHVYVKKDHVDSFIKATVTNHEKSIHEPGNARFDILQLSSDPTEFALYEAYESESAASAHKETAHYLEWREKVAPWMEKPRVGIRYDAVRP